jgi:hypothetical protein
MASLFVHPSDAATREESARSKGAPTFLWSTAGPAGRRGRLPSKPARFSHRALDPSCRTPSLAAPLIGNVLYLGCVVLVAAGTVAVFFGMGFSLLVPPVGGTITGSGIGARPEVTLLQPFAGNAGHVPPTENVGAEQNIANLPAPATSPARAGDDLLRPSGEVATPAPLPPQNAPPTPAATAVPTSTAVAATSLTEPGSVFSAAEIRGLLEHGDSLLRNGDLASARLFYERAANAGDGRAALRLGASFDPAFLGRLGLGKLQADAVEARLWYGRALDLGAVEAKNQLNSLDKRQGNNIQ